MFFGSCHVFHWCQSYLCHCLPASLMATTGLATTHWPLRTKIEALEVWVGKHCGRWCDRWCDAKHCYNIDFWKEPFLESNRNILDFHWIFDFWSVFVFRRNTCQRDETSIMVSPDELCHFIRLPSFSVKKTLASLTATITVGQSDFNAAVQKQKDSLGVMGVLGWLRYVSTKAQVGFWQMRFLNSYD